MTDEVVVDDFDKAFNEVVASMEAIPSVDTPPVTPPAVPPATPPEPPVVPPVDIPKDTPPAPPADPVIVPVVPPIVPAAPAAAAPTPPPAPTSPPASPPETPEAKTAREAFEKSIAPYVPTAEETAAEEKMKADFPGEYAAMMSKFKMTDHDINARVHTAIVDVMKQVAPRLATVEQTSRDGAFNAHVTALHTAHADFDAVVPKVAEWIKTLPSYAQVGAQAVFNEGTTQEVIALVAEYKKANNMATPIPPAPPPAPPAPPAKPKADGADLTPVSSRRPVTTPKGTPDMNDFDGAWAEAVTQLT